MTKLELLVTTDILRKYLCKSGYTTKESIEILIASGKLLEGITDEKSEQDSEKGDDRLFLYNNRLSSL